MGKLLKWINDSNHGKHYVYGVAIGIGSDDPYCAAYVGIGVASALEFKDKSWGGKWDWQDWACTVAGVATGFGLRLLVKGFLR